MVLLQIGIAHGSLEPEYSWNDRRSNSSNHSTERAERQKRDFRAGMLETELLTVMRTYNSEITSQAKSVTSSILSRSADVNGLRNLLAFSFNNLATNGLNDVSVLSKILL